MNFRLETEDADSLKLLASHEEPPTQVAVITRLIREATAELAEGAVVESEEVVEEALERLKAQYEPMLGPEAAEKQAKRELGLL